VLLDIHAVKVRTKT